jgi:diacylglycerol O-acyltransferase
VYTRVRLPLRDVRTVKDAAGVSVNDVALAVVGGALRRVLDDRGEQVDGPLTASVPVSTEPPGAPPRQWGNRFSALLTSLATDIDDPWERLAAVHAVTTEAKRRFDVSGAARMPELVDHVPPLVARPALQSVWRAMRDGTRRPDASVLVSNLRGPEDRWRFAEAEVEELYLSGPPSGGVGSNVMLWSYAGDLVLSILSFADSLRSPSLFADALRAALVELVEAAHPMAG